VGVLQWCSRSLDRSSDVPRGALDVAPGHGCKALWLVLDSRWSRHLALIL
jgi:hypothetical protein